MKPQRIQLKRTKGWKMPPNTVKVDRGTVWGNPFVVGQPSGCDFNDAGDPTPMIAAMTIQDALHFYRTMVTGILTPEMHPHGHRWMKTFKAKMRGGHPSEMIRCYLRGKNLACWCKIGEACHADVLLEIANGEQA